MQPRLRVLLVEDDPNDEIMTLHSFRKSNLPVDITVVRDGGEALDYLFGTGSFVDRDTRSMPDRVFLDLNLPKVSGFDVLKRIKSDERTRRVPVTMLTGSDNEIIVSEILRHGADACLSKPLTTDMIAEVFGRPA